MPAMPACISVVLPPVEGDGSWRFPAADGSATCLHLDPGRFSCTGEFRHLEEAAYRYPSHRLYHLETTGGTGFLYLYCLVLRTPAGLLPLPVPRGCCSCLGLLCRYACRLRDLCRSVPAMLPAWICLPVTGYQVPFLLFCILPGSSERALPTLIVLMQFLCCSRGLLNHATFATTLRTAFAGFLHGWIRCAVYNDVWFCIARVVRVASVGLWFLDAALPRWLFALVFFLVLRLPCATLPWCLPLFLSPPPALWLLLPSAYTQPYAAAALPRSAAFARTSYPACLTPPPPRHPPCYALAGSLLQRCSVHTVAAFVRGSAAAAGRMVCCASLARTGTLPSFCERGGRRGEGRRRRRRERRGEHFTVKTSFWNV